MVRKAYFIRREKYKNARAAVDDLEKIKRCILKPGTLIAFERGSVDIGTYTTKKLAELYNVTVEELTYEDGQNWKILNRKCGR